MEKRLLTTIVLAIFIPFVEGRCGLEMILLNGFSFKVDKCTSIVGSSDSQVCSCIKVNDAEQILNCVMTGDSISNQLTFFDLDASTIALNYETCFDAVSPLLLTAGEDDVQVLPVDLVIETTNLYSVYPIFAGMGQEYSVLGVKYMTLINSIDIEDNPNLSAIDVSNALRNQKATASLKGIKIANSFSTRSHEILNLNMIFSNNMEYIYLNNVSVLVDMKVFMPNSTKDEFKGPILNGPVESDQIDGYSVPGIQISKTMLKRDSFYYIINREMIMQTLSWNLSPENDALFWPSVFSTPITVDNSDNIPHIEFCDRKLDNLNKEALMFAGLVGTVSYHLS